MDVTADGEVMHLVLTGDRSEVTSNNCGTGVMCQNIYINIRHI